MNEIVRTVTDGVLRHLAVGSVAALVLVLSALVFVKAARIRTPVYRHMVWLYCLVGIVGLPLIWLYGPKLTLAVLPARAPTHASPASPAVGPDREGPLGDTGLNPARPLTAATPSARQETVLSWKAAAAALWFLGFSIMVTKLAVGWLRLRRICRGAVPLEESEYPTGWASPSLRLCLTSQLPGPVCFGMFRPVILLPQDMVHGGSREDLRMVLTHELAHVERRDCWANLFQRLVEAMYFFHPLVWLASRQLTQQREEICDNHVLAEGVSPDDYTTLLSHLGTQSVHAGYLQTVALFEGQLLSRIRSLLDPSRCRQTKLPWRVAAVGTVAVLAGFLVFGSVRLAAQSSDRATGSSPGSPGSSSASIERRPVQSSAVAAAASEKPEQPRYAARTFNSQTPWLVFFQETSLSEWRFARRTPSPAPLKIPACWCWWVQTQEPVKDWDLLVREVNQSKVPGLRLLAATDADVKHLADLTELVWLDLGRAEVTDTGLATLKDLTGLRLEKLGLVRTRVTDAGLACLASMTRLRQLDLIGMNLTDAGLRHLRGLTQLCRLALLDSQITDAGLENLRGLTQLQRLDLSYTRAEGGWTYLGDLVELQDLRLDNTQVTDSALVHLQRLAKLRLLNLANTRITDKGLEHLKGIRTLTALVLNGTQITDAGLKHLKDLPELQGLHLGDTTITDAGLKHLKDLPELQGLDLYNTPIRGPGLEHLKALANLRYLHLSGTQITDAGLEHIKGLRTRKAIDSEIVQV